MTKQAPAITVCVHVAQHLQPTWFQQCNAVQGKGDQFQSQQRGLPDDE